MATSIAQAQKAALANGTLIKYGFIPSDDKFAPNEVILVLENFAKDLVADLVASITQKDKIATRALLQSVSFDIKFMENTLNILFFMEKYWDEVNDGQPKGTRVPIEDLVEWIKAKPIQPRVKAGQDLNDARVQLAYLIQRAIREHGTKASHFFTEVVTPARIEQLKKDISAALGRDVLVNIIKDIPKLN